MLPLQDKRLLMRFIYFTTSASEDILFPKLPIELRLKIFKLHCPAAQHVQLNLEDSGPR
jgi:hypothetical protein